MKTQFLGINGATLWLAQQGLGLPVVLISGGPGCSDYLEPVAGVMDDVAQTIRFDWRGCGRSSHTPPYNLETAIADLDMLRSILNLEQWVVLVLCQANFAWWQAGGAGEAGGLGREEFSPPAPPATPASPARPTLQFWVGELLGDSWGADVALAYALTHPSCTIGVIYLSGRELQNDSDWKQAYRKGRDAGKEESIPLIKSG